MTLIDQQTSSHLRLFLETALDAVVIMDSDGVVVEWNRFAVEIFGWSRDEALGRALSELIIPPKFRTAHYQGLKKYLDTGEGPILRKRIEVTGMRKSGEEFPVELSIAPLQEGVGILFVGSLRDITGRKRWEEQQNLLMAELNHRVKNTLAVVGGIASQTARTSSSLPEFTKSFLARIQILGRAHDMLMARKWGMMQLYDLIAGVLTPFGTKQITYAGPPVSLPPGIVLSLSLIFHELVTNASKYGALALPAGHVAVTWDLKSTETGPHLTLRWHESGLSAVTTPTRSGFGTRMIEASTKHDLSGQVDVSYSLEGVRYDFDIPLP